MFSPRSLLFVSLLILSSALQGQQTTGDAVAPPLSDPSILPIIITPPVANFIVEDPFVLTSEENTLTTMHRQMVTRAFPLNDATKELWQIWATNGWKEHNGNSVAKDQAVVVVNRNPKVQKIAVMVIHPDGTWTLIGVSPTSTGQAGRKTHFISPLGIFDHDGSIMDYRALGTKNSNGIRGIGAKGSRVWDFGWQVAQTGWLAKPEQRTIRFELHATDPDLLEQRLGHPASEGCIRISAGLNKFLDHFSILDEAYLQDVANGSRAVSALLPKDRQPMLSGRYMMVIDAPMPIAEDKEMVQSESIATSP